MALKTELIVILFLFLIKKGFAEITLNPHVTISEGVLMGETGESAHGRPFHKFWCIPYGKHERFEPSVQPDPWEGVFDATACSTSCPQSVLVPGSGDNALSGFFTEIEDCLILNVFTPSTVNYSTPLPVMFYIHGGYFMLGTALMYSAELFLDEDVVVVTINYRLGALGFLTTNDGEIEGNLALKDMVVALEWVQRNIRSFGGDPEKVTIFGESAGGGAVGFLVLSPMAKGLFRYAISQSGGVVSPWSFQSKPEEVFQEFVANINCSASTTRESVACLKAKTMEEISNNQNTKWFFEVTYPTFPSVETYPPKNSKAFLPEHPRKMLMEGNFNRVPYMDGVCEDEGAYQSGFVINDDELLASLNEGWIPNAGIAVGIDTRNISLSKMNAGLRKLRRFYFGDNDIDRVKHLYNVTDLFSDAWFMQSLAPTIKYYSQYAPIYPYIFSKKGEMHPTNFLGHFDRPMTSHGDDIIYQFMKGVFSSDADVAFSRNFIRLWVSFVYTGKPIATWGSAKHWPYVEPGTFDDYKFYFIDEDTSLRENPYKDRFNLWLDLADNEWNEFTGSA